MLFDRYENMYWWGSIWQVLVMILFLISIWCTRDCSGISLRSQILYALVFTTRHRDLRSSYYEHAAENIAIKITYLLVTYGTVFSVLLHFKKTYEKQNDTSRIEISIISCIVLSLIVNDSLQFWDITMAFSVYHETVAMIPQFQFINKTKRIDKKVFLYVVGMATYSLLQIDHLYNQSFHYGTAFRIVAATTQFLLYCDFFRGVYPLLCPRDAEDDDCPPKVCSNIYSFMRSRLSKDVQANVENGAPTTGHLASNVSDIVLSASTLTGIHEDKEHFTTGDVIKT